MLYYPRGVSYVIFRSRGANGKKSIFLPSGLGEHRAERIIQHRNTQAGGAGFVGVPCIRVVGCGKSLESDARPLTCTFDAPCPAVLINTAGVRGIRRLIAITSGPTLIP